MNRVDANVVLRYLLDDHEQLSEQAAAIIENEDVYLSFEVICEIVYVLMGVYKVTRAEIVETIKGFLQGENIATSDQTVASTALDLFAQKNIDLVDAILCAYHNRLGDTILTFDKKIETIIKEQTLSSPAHLPNQQQ